MSAKTGIEWTDSSWNPTAGCSIVSPGCRDCYAMTMAHRIGANPGSKYAGLTRVVNGNAVWTGEVRADEKALDAPLHWRAPRRIFVDSMSDLFHEGVADDFIDRVFAVMALCPQHVFQVLTKRAERMRAYAAARLGNDAEAVRIMLTAFHAPDPGKWCMQIAWPLPNVWLGVSVEDQQRADERIPPLLETPAAVRFVSAEPLLGPVNLLGHMLGFAAGNPAACANCGHSHGFTRCPNTGRVTDDCHHRDCDCTGFRHTPGVGIDWVIAGGESGPKARPMHPDWARQVRDQCRAAGVPFFFKQWGEWAPAPPEAKWSDYDAWPEHRKVLWSSGDTSLRAGKKAAGALLDGRAWSEWPA